MAEQRLQAPHAAALLAMVAQRPDRPGSKLACHERWLDRVWLPEARDLGLHQLYRAMDLLAEHGAAIGQAVFWRAADLFELDVDLVFYDGTTAWFETDEEDIASHEWRGLTFAPLRRRGHSKEGRDNDPQVVIALAVTRDGVPVRSWVFPGNTPDVTTVQAIKADLREMRLGRVLFVGDAGLYSKANLDALAKGAGRYVPAAPVGRVREIRDEVLSHPGRYAEIGPRLRAKEVVLGEGERRRRYVLCLNEEEADKQRRHRAEILALLGAELAGLKADHPEAACRLLASKRFGPYLSQGDDGRPYLDQAKVRRAEQLDGKFVLTTNDDTLSVADVALGYKGHVDHRGLLPAAEDHRPRGAADVPPDAAPDHRAREAVRAGADDPAHGRDRDRAALAPARRHPMAAQGRPLHERGPDHRSGHDRRSLARRPPREARGSGARGDPRRRLIRPAPPTCRHTPVEGVAQAPEFAPLFQSVHHRPQTRAYVFVSK